MKKIRKFLKQYLWELEIENGNSYHFSHFQNSTTIHFDDLGELREYLKKFRYKGNGLFTFGTIYHIEPVTEIRPVAYEIFRIFQSNFFDIEGYRLSSCAKIHPIYQIEAFPYYLLRREFKDRHPWGSITSIATDLSDEEKVYYFVEYVDGNDKKHWDIFYEKHPW